MEPDMLDNLPPKMKALVEAKAATIRSALGWYVLTFKDGQRMFFDEKVDRKDLDRSAARWAEFSRA